MITIPEVVEQIIKSSPFLEEGMQENIINFSGLARLIKPEIEEKTMKEVTEGAIVMALNRFAANMKRSSISKNIFALSPDMIVRSNLVEYTLQNSEFLIQKHKKILEQMGNQSYFLVLTQGVFETTIIISKELQNKIEAIFSPKEIVARIDNLSAITLRLPLESITTPAVFYHIHKILAWEGINVVEVASTLTEFTLVLKEMDVDRAFSILKKGLTKVKTL